MLTMAAMVWIPRAGSYTLWMFPIGVSIIHRGLPRVIVRNKKAAGQQNTAADVVVP